MTKMQYMQAFLKHNYSVLYIKVYMQVYNLVDIVKKKMFVWQGKGDVKDYYTQALKQSLKTSTGRSESEGNNLPEKRKRDSLFDHVFAIELFKRVGLTGDRLTQCLVYLTPQAYVHFSVDYSFMQMSIKYGKIKTGKDFLEFLAFVTDASLRTIEYKLGEELYTRVYSDAPVEELYFIFDTEA